MTALRQTDAPQLDYADEWADIAYTRISDDRTGIAASPARQRKAIGDAVADEGKTITHWFEDLSRSAYKAGVVRPDFDALLTACEEHPVRRVWVLHDDRLIRDGDDTDLPRLVKALAPRKVLIRCIEAADIKIWQAEGKMSARVRNAVNAYESERKKERVELAAEDRARRGRFSGGVRRFGYTQSGTRTTYHIDDEGHRTESIRPSGQLVLVPDEADAIRAGYRMILDGESINAVTRDWRARGLTGVQGGPLTPMVVRQVLLRPANAGISTYRGEVVGTGDWPAIVEPKTFYDVQSVLSDPSRRTNVGRPAAHLLSGILRCAACGGPMNASSKSRGSQTQEYRCKSGRQLPDPTGGQHVSRRRAKLDEAITDVLLRHIIGLAKTLTKPSKTTSKSVAKALTDAAELRGKIEAYKARADEYEPDDLAGILRTLRAKLTKIDKSIATSAGNPATQKLLRASDIPAEWAKMSTADKRVVIKENLSKIVVGPGKWGSRNASMHNVQVFDRDGKLIYG